MFSDMSTLLFIIALIIILFHLLHRKLIPQGRILPANVPKVPARGLPTEIAEQAPFYVDGKVFRQRTPSRAPVPERTVETVDFSPQGDESFFGWLFERNSVEKLVEGDDIVITKKPRRPDRRFPAKVVKFERLDRNGWIVYRPFQGGPLHRRPAEDFLWLA